jgi:predicted dienelactone hydrolase
VILGKDFAMRKYITFWLLCIAALGAHAAVGLTVLPGTDWRGPVTMFYPSSSQAATTTRGPFTLNVALQGSPSPGNRRLVIFSHGSGGSPWPLTDFAASLVEAGFIVAMPEHAGDNYKDQSKVGPETWKLRPREVSQAIDAVQADARFATQVDFTQVGVYGTSAGGLTALTLAGARWSPANFQRHCLAHMKEDFPACVGLITRLKGDWLDPVKLKVAGWAHRMRFQDETWQQHTDTRIKAVIASVPMAAPIDMASIAQPRISVALVQSEFDPWLAPRFHGNQVQSACISCVDIPNLPKSGHGTLLSPWPQELAQSLTPLLQDPPGFDRAQLPVVYGRMTAFFKAKLSTAQ